MASREPRGYNSGMDSIVFTITRNPGEGYCAVAEGEGYSLFTEGRDLDELSAMIADVVETYFEDPSERPKTIIWHFNAADLAA